MSRSILAALLAVVTLAGPLPVAAHADEAAIAVERAMTLVDQAAEAVGAEREGLLRAALAALEGDPLLAANRWLREPLAASPPDLRGARARLAGARSALGAPSPGQRDASAARSTLETILSNPPFQGRDMLLLLPSWLVPLGRLIADIADLLWKLIRWPFDRLVELCREVFRGLFFTPAVLALGLIIVAGLIVLYRHGLRAAIVAQAEMALPAAEFPPTASEALAAAQQLAMAGRYREASHFVFLSTLLWIEERGRARFDPTATNREHLARVADQPPLVAALTPVVARFDRLWYGQDAVTDADYRDLLALAGRVREGTR